MEFSATGAILTNFKASSHGDDDERTDAIHVAFSCNAPGEILTALMGCEEVPVLWAADEDKAPLHLGVNKVSLYTTAKADKLWFGRVKFKAADLKSFAFKPAPGGTVDLTFSASIYEPQDGHAEGMRHMLKRKAKLTVRTEPDLFEEPSEPDPEEEQPDLELPM